MQSDVGLASSGWLDLGSALPLTLSPALPLLGPQFPQFEDRGCWTVFSTACSTLTVYEASECWNFAFHLLPGKEVRILFNNEVDLIRE